MSNRKTIASWVFSIIVAVIYLQTLFFKFTGSPESVYIFEKVAGAGNEALPRIGSGIAELITSFLVLIPRTRVYGAILSVLVIAGAIFSHLAILGIVVMDDGGALFILALVILLLSLALIYIHKSEIPFLGGAS